MNNERVNAGNTAASVLAGVLKAPTSTQLDLRIELNHDTGESDISVVIMGATTVPIDGATVTDDLLHLLNAGTPSDGAAAVGSLPVSTRYVIAHLLLSYQSKEPVMMMGPTSTKSFALSVALAMLGKRQEKVVHIYLTEGTEVADVLG